MGLRTLFLVVGSLGVAVEIALLVVLIVRHQYREFPVFTLYIAYNTLIDIVVLLSVAVFSVGVERTMELASLPLQYLLELLVLFEIAWKVLRPVQASIPKGLIRFFLLLIACAMIGGTLLAWRVPATGNKLDALDAPLKLTVGLLRMLIFAVTAGFAQMLGIGWKNKVLRLATALSFYSAVDLMITLAERHMSSPNTLAPIRATSYLLELGFLLWTFTTKDADRGEFSPQMEQFLVTLAGRAKLARTTLVRR